MLTFKGDTAKQSWPEHTRAKLGCSVEHLGNSYRCFKYVTYFLIKGSYLLTKVTYSEIRDLS